MGYTHYWSMDPTKCPADKFLLLAQDTQKIIAAAAERGIPLAWEYDETERPPEIGEGVIRFNGIGEDGHETFLLDFTPIIKPATELPAGIKHWQDTRDRTLQDLWWQWREYEDCERRGMKRWAFCKTARKPYDEPVCVILLRAAIHFPEGFRLDSDGQYDNEESGGYGYRTWENAKALYRDVFGEEPPADPFSETIPFPA